MCKIPTASSNKKKIILLTLADNSADNSAPAKARFKLSRWFGKRHKTDAFTKLGNLLSELRVPHKQCLIGISDAFSASFTSIWPSFPRFYYIPNRACLLCLLSRGFTIFPTKRAYSAHLPSAVPWISEDRLLYQGQVVRKACMPKPLSLRYKVQSVSQPPPLPPASLSLSLCHYLWVSESQ